MPGPARLFSTVLLLLLVLPEDAAAYRCSRTGTDSGPSQYWDTRRIGWYAGAEGTGDIADSGAALAAIRASFQTWTDVDCSDVELDFLGAEPGLHAGFDPAGGPNRNVVVFKNQGWSYGDGVIAVTTNSFDPRTGLIFDADIELNDQSFEFVLADLGCVEQRGAMDLQNTLTHEIGHLLGLDHPPATLRYQDTTMFASAPACETKKRSLEADDMAGLCAIYPAGQQTVQCFPSSGPSFLVVETDDGFGCSATGGGSGAGLAPLLGLATLWLFRKRSLPRA